MRLVLLFCVFLIGGAQCRPGVFNWLNSGKNAAKGLIDTGSTSIMDVMRIGDVVVQTGSTLASKGLGKAINFTTDAVNMSASIGSNLFSGGANIANKVLDKINDAAEAVDSVIHVPVASMITKPIVAVSKTGVKGVNSVGQAAISTGESVANAGLGVTDTLGQVNIKALGGLATAATLGGQAGTAGAAAVKKTLVDNLAKLTYKGLTWFANPPNSTDLEDLQNPLYSGLGFLVNPNTYDSVNLATPYFIDAVTRFWSTFNA